MPSLKLDPCWRKALLGAKLLLSRRKLTRGRAALANTIGRDPSVTPRLLDQAIAYVCAKRSLDYEKEMARIQMGTGA